MSEMSSTSVVPSESLEQTVLAAQLLAQNQDLEASPFRGSLTVRQFSGLSQEIAALTGHAGVFDLGYRAFVKITGGDRVRWLNGMVSNTIVGLEEGKSNYSFLLNAQGRILGDATIHRFSDHFILETDLSQRSALAAHLDHFIIMDDVELQPLDASTTAIGIAGPQAALILARVGLLAPLEHTSIRLKNQAGWLAGSQSMRDKGKQSPWQATDITITHPYSPVVQHFEIKIGSLEAPALWTALTNAGANPSGAAALESLRILEGTPLYGVDIRDRHLPQETAQTRALNFNKGCYLGQEIVERIRSRATVHRTFRQFALAQPPLPLEPGQVLPIDAEGAERNPVGELTSVAEYDLSGVPRTIALGFVRTEALERGLPITCNGTAVTVLDAPPKIERL